MSRHTAMQRPPRLSDHRELVSRESRDLFIADAFVDDEAATCSVRDARAALAGLPVRPPTRSGISYIEDSDVVSSIGHDSVTSFAARPSAIPTLDSDDVALASERALLGLTREVPLVAPEPEPDFVCNTMLMTLTPMASARPVYRSQMMSVPPPPDSWVETPWVVPSVRGPSFAPPVPARDAKSILQTTAIVGTGVLMLAVVFGAVLFARSDSEEQLMQFSSPRSGVAAQALRAPVQLAPTPTMQVVTAPDTPVVPVIPTVKPRVTVAPNATAPVVHGAPLAPTPHVRELPPRTRVEAPKPAAKEKAEPARKTREEESVEALLKKLGEEQLSR